MVLESVAFDIETTGFGVDDAVTVVGFAVPMGVRVFVQTGGRSVTGLETRVRERVDEHVVVSVHESERELLEGVGEFVGRRLCDREVLLLAYNGERWKSGFDLPFLRTRLAQHGLAWPFSDVPYADLMPLISRRFNTTRSDASGDESQSDLVGVYETLCGGEYSGLDPFEASKEAVSAFEAGRFGDVVVHNVADVLRTQALGRLAESYCSKSDFNVKSLTPTITDS
ncbi:3'-5' exonuclease family protein [Halobacterium jilantaiense]|uniref:RNase_H superfamily protein n=1 Tax=Halobacterium jilantaiense TaxID=355548 RepID=A0A1I0NHV1_9EURY|nr:hypothetical protein [Halobacterium jilantaiense]SEW00893.1 hypothetical protein SAMN04487945_0882 [Halobacterium jilantaiense]